MVACTMMISIKKLIIQWIFKKLMPMVFFFSCTSSSRSSLPHRMVKWPIEKSLVTPAGKKHLVNSGYCYRGNDIWN